MMMGLPVIATNWGGCTEFMTSETACLLDYELVKVEATDPGFEHYQGHRWAEPSCEHLRQWLRRLQKNPAEGKAIGTRARAHVPETFQYRVWHRSRPSNFGGTLSDDERVRQRINKRDQPVD